MSASVAHKGAVGATVLSCGKDYLIVSHGKAGCKLY